MSDAPDRIAAWPDFDGQYSVTGQWSTNTHPENAVAYVRADLSDALLREAVEALQWLREVTEPPDRNCSCHRSAPCGWCEQHAAVAEAHEETRATLAKLRSHMGGNHE